MFLFFLFLLFAVCLNGKASEAVRQKCERPGLLREDGGETGWAGRVSVLDETEYFVCNHVGSILKSHLSCVLTQGFQLLVVGNRFKCELQ